MNRIRGLYASARQWQAVLARHQRKMSLVDRLAFAGTLLRAAVGLWPVPKVERQRRDSICQRCPIFNLDFKMCRPFFGSDLGCGCYQPVILFQKDGRCWADLNLPASEGLGWETNKTNRKL